MNISEYIVLSNLIYISSHKWSTTHRVLRSHKSKMSVIYMLSWKQCALPIITTMALWQLMHLSTCCTVHDVPKCMSCHKAIVVITGSAHCFYDCIYIKLILLLWDSSTLCVVDHLWLLKYMYICIYVYIYNIYV